MQRLKLALPLFLAALLPAAPGFADGHVVVGIAPPAPAFEAAAPAPAAGYVWQPGYWSWNGWQYVWIPGAYLVAPWPGIAWVPGRWVVRGGGWVWVGGY